MPSAARQRLPIDLWRPGYKKHLGGSPNPLYHTQEIHASPGHCDAFPDDRQENQQGTKRLFNKSPKKHVNSGGTSPKVMTRRGASTPSMGWSDSESSHSSSRHELAEYSSSAKSDSCFRYGPSIAFDAYAMESSVAPHPSEVPFPPLEWLQSSSKRSHSPVIISDMSLTAILGCHMAVQ